MDADPVVTLAYHRISPRLIAAGTWVGPGQLARHLDILTGSGFAFVSPDEFLLQKGAPADRTAKPGVLLTFDDATEDIHLFAHILNDRGIQPVVFVPVDFLGQANTWEWNLPGRQARHCSALQVRELADAGWEIGLHGSSHQDLTRLSCHEQEQEITAGRRRLGEITGRAVRFFSYPFGLADDRVVERVRDAGFEAAFLMNGKTPGRNVMLLPRRPVYCIDTSRDILAKVKDPAGKTLAGRWQLWKEGAAHRVGQIAVRIRAVRDSA